MHSIKDISAIALHVFRSSSRLRILHALAAAIAAFLLLLFFNIDTDGDRLYFIKGFLAYSNYIVLLFSGLGTVCAACYLFRMEIEHKHYYFTLTKPVKRGRVLIGHWLGIGMVNLALVLFGSAVIIALVFASLSRAGDTEKAAIKETLLCANKVVEPDEIRKEEEAVIEKGKSAKWTFSSIGAGHGQITLDLDYFSSSPAKIDPIDIIFRAGKEEGAFEQRLTTYQSMPTQLKIPASAISGGRLDIELTNMSVRGRSIYVPEPDGLTIFYPAASFSGNFARLMLYTVLRNAFLAAVTLFLCSFLTFPVALISSVIYFIASMSGRMFLMMSKQEVVFSADLVEEGTVAPAEILDSLFRGALRFLYYFSGRAADISPAALLSDSRLLEWSGKLFSIYALWTVYAVVLLTLGGLIFTRSEISRLER